MADSSLGRDLPAEDRVSELPVRPVSADLGYGVSAADIELGHRSVEPQDGGDNRSGDIASPFTSELPAQKGFLYRGRFPTDR